MPTRKFDVSQARELEEFLGISIEGALKRALLGTAHRIVQQVVTVVIPAEPRQPVDRGAYRAGWRAKKVPGGAEVRNSLPYSSVIEYGARAENVKVGRKMIDALAEWVLRKGMLGRAGGNGTDAKAAARKVAWAIATSFKAKGIFDEGKGLRVLEKATKALDRFFWEEVRTELEREFSG